MTLTDSHASARGLWLKRDVDSIPGLSGLRGRVIDEIVAAVTALNGARAGDLLRSEGIQALHRVLDARDIGRVRDRVLETLRLDLLGMAMTVGRHVLGWDGEFYIDDYLILRINLPYEVAKAADGAAENPGIGRVSPSMRDIAASRRVKDPVFDPKSYHRGHPPAAWAHGPHLDSWSGHSLDGVNLWWAIGEVPAEAGMVLYPQLADTPLACDRRTLYIRLGQILPVPTFVPLAAGDMLVFDPEILHGTHLNVTGQTRVAVSLRLNASRPKFDSASFYAREFWRKASDLMAGRFDAILHLKREDNLGQPVQQGAPSITPRRYLEASSINGSTVTIGPSDSIPDGGRAIVPLPDGRQLMVLRTSGGLTAVDARCPHYDLELADGGDDGARIFCPGCTVAFDLRTGRSAAPSLRLSVYPVRDEDGVIVLDTRAVAPVDSAPA